MIDRQRQTEKVTLEDLLRLKRAERPPAEFWADFERSLHAKQLAAIVEKRPWWRQNSWLRTSRWSLPLSAAAALTVAFATVGHPTLAKLKASRSPSTKTALRTILTPAPVATATLAATAPSAQHSPTTQAANVNTPAPARITREDAVPAMSVASLERKSPAPVFVAAATAQPVEASTKTSSQGLSMTEQIAGLVVAPDTDSSGAHFAAVSSRDTLAVPELGSFLDKSVARLDTTRAERTRVIEPLSQVPTPKEARRARLVALLSLPGYDDAADSAATSSRSRERSLNHFNDQALYDAISRLEMKGKRSSDAAIQF